ncbi:MAG: LPP20 family lipoprotein [Bacteroidetes bacterium]|nr:LPP20 family lipoprotein [Bacteroidota bacterium]MBU1114433.1 LPP20 family lipoprotein [Bacteroidota bacterium]MBU1800529.1 LPP20 family lipoprotein [Bacteroidota bacterium]
MKKNTLLIFTALTISLLLFSCGGSKSLSETETGDIPEWYLNTPTSENYIFEAASATSRDMDLALNKAETEARAKIGRTMTSKINSMQKKFEEEVGEGENSELLSQFTQATKVIVSTELNGSRVKEKKFVKDGSNWRTYVLMEYPIGAAQKAFLNKIKDNNNLYTRFRATDAMKEMEADIQKYEEWKKNN